MSVRAEVHAMVSLRPAALAAAIASKISSTPMSALPA
jgi:hypothetical protein